MKKYKLYGIAGIAIVLGSIIGLFLAADTLATDRTAAKVALRTPADAVEISDPSAHTSLAEQVATWIEAIAQQAPFDKWKHAEWSSYPLGPGTHSWIVIIHQDGTELGYIVVSSTMEGEYMLSEYGIGTYPLFSMSTLRQAMVHQGQLAPSISQEQLEQQTEYTLTRYYVNALLAFWQVSTIEDTWFLDAKSGEQLPLHSDDVNLWSDAEQGSSLPMNPASPISPAITDVWQRLTFDPYERINWLKNDPLAIESFNQLSLMMQALSTEKQVKTTYVAHLLDKRMVIPLAVVGYHLWDTGESYVAVDQDGSRYIPFPVLQEHGDFYK